MTPRTSRIFGIVGLALGILMVMLEAENYRRSGEVAWFWVVVAALMAALGLYGIIAKPPMQ